MTRLPFTKMHGLGNNYIYVDRLTYTEPLPPYPELAKKVSNQNTGIGSDGLILILPSEIADVKMRIFNSDGSEAKNCGNGLRCVAKYAFEHGLVKKEHFSIETISGKVEAKVFPTDGGVDKVTIDMGEPILERKRIPMTGGKPEETVIQETHIIEGQAYQITGVSMGNPHGIFIVDNIHNIPINELGPELADGHDLFPEGTNVGFVEVISENEIHYRVWERGSGITQACGTGACAAVVASILEGRIHQGELITVHLAGGDLQIEWDSESNHVWMTGAAVTICDGMFFLS
ncbi:diaminopimelate epimerase [Terrilactibacillus laevilacticus]|uniref:diaminopimelate epimerase n=1 Tax=Terrilactibacillus laevilacticus TaxID=1380157 RepID=UPI001146D2B2|nr:diaminopimelate epimerase [Terrilactibacillus laevilacticus]